MARNRYQIRFTKTGVLRWISHRDLARLWERMVRRVGVRLAMSEGFSPKAKISFPTALALGVESFDEVVELELVEAITAEELLGRLQSDEVSGLEVVEVMEIPDGAPKAQFVAGHYHLVSAEDAPLDLVDLQSRIDQFWERDTLTFQRKDREVCVSAREHIEQLRVHEGRLEITLRASRVASPRPHDVLAALGLDSLLEAGARLVRSRTDLDREPGQDWTRARVTA